MGLAQSAILGVVVLLALLFVVRPMAMRLTVAGEALGGNGRNGADVAMLPGEGGSHALVPVGAGSGVPMLTDDSMVDMANIEGQLRASSLRKLAEMVEKHPDESLSIMRGWLNQERA
jgi:flagellar M-ring protein FliF